MIESGLSNWALANAAINALLGQTPQEVALKSYSAFYFSFAQKMPVMPAIVLDRIMSSDVVDTLDPRSPAPGEMIEGKFQFGSIANDDPKNPKNPSGYLSAALLSQALRRQLMGLATGRAALPDGTLINDVKIIDEFDAHFELGGSGYLYRRVLQVMILFTETS